MERYLCEFGSVICRSCEGSACLWQSLYLAIVSLCVDCMCVSVGTHSALVLAELVNRNSSSHLNWRGIRDDL